MTDLEDLVRPMLDADLGAPPAVSALRQRSKRRKRGRLTRTTVAGALTLALIVGITVLARRTTDNKVVTTGLPPNPAAVDVSPGWHDVDPGPTADVIPGSSSAWTGTELVVFGYHDAAPSVSARSTEAWAYTPSTGHWSTLPPPPALQAGAQLAWTGNEVVALDSFQGAGQARRAATWTPGSDHWRDLPALQPTGLVIVTNPILVWTGTELIDTVSLSRVSLTASTWEPIAPIPTAMAGHDLFPAWDGNQLLWLPNSGTEGWSYDPATDAWSALPAAPTTRQRSRPIWNGHDMVVGPDVYTPATGAWSELPPTPVDPTAYFGAGNRGMNGCAATGIAVDGATFENLCAAIVRLDTNRTWTVLATDTPPTGPPRQMDPSYVAPGGPGPLPARAIDLHPAGSALITWRRPVLSYAADHGYTTTNPGGSPSLIRIWFPPPSGTSSQPTGSLLTQPLP